MNSLEEGFHNLLPSHKKIVFIFRENYYICTISVKLTRIETGPEIMDISDLTI
jgi:hypothetical protein